MRIIIDLQGAQTDSRYRGIGRYSLSLAKAIVRNRGEHEVIIVLNNYYAETISPIKNEFRHLLPKNNIKIWGAPEQGFQSKCNASEIIREAFIASLEPDLVHIMSLFEYSDGFVASINRYSDVPVSVSLYDLIPLLNPEQYLKPNPDFEKSYLKKVAYLKQASLLLGISEATCQEGIVALGDNRPEIHNISTAADSNFRKIEITTKRLEILKNKFNISDKIVLYTGGADERKNLSRLICAYALLDSELRDNYQLVFAGKFPIDTIEQLKKLAKKKGLVQEELIFTGYITDDELVEFYNVCTLYVFPSWHEGFGLPALEAMSCGAAVIGANTTSLPEVIGNNDALFDPFSAREIADKIEQSLRNETFRQSLIEYGENQSKLFSWDKTAKEAIRLMEQLVCPELGSKKEKPDTSQLIAAVVNSDGSHSEQKLISMSRDIAQNHPFPRKKHIFIDVSELVNSGLKSGIQRVTRSIIKVLAEKSAVDYLVKAVYATSESQGYFYANTMNAQDSFDELSTELINVECGDIFLGLDLNHQLVRQKLPFLNSIREVGADVYFVIYDFLPIQFPHAFNPLAEKNHAIWLDVITKFDGALCISNTVKSELEDWMEKRYPERKENFKVSWFRLGADLSNVGESKEAVEKDNDIIGELNRRPSFLMVGTLEPRKGYAQTLMAIELLWKQGFDVNLIIVGSSGWLVDKLIIKINEHAEFGKRLFWLKEANDETLEQLYSESTCLIAASDGEGFGLPLIEASRKRLPIIAYDIPVFREVAGDNAFYFTCKAPQFMADEIEHWLTLYKKNKHPTSEGVPWLTWQESANELVSKAIKMQNGIIY